MFIGVAAGSDSTLAMLLMLSLNRLATSAMEHAVLCSPARLPVKLDCCGTAVVGVVGTKGEFCMMVAIGEESSLKCSGEKLLLVPVLPSECPERKSWMQLSSIESIGDVTLLGGDGSQRN